MGKLPVIMKFRNVGLDFSSDYVFKKMLSSGNVKVQEIIGSGPNYPSGLKLGKTRIAKLVNIGGKKKYKIFEGGSPLNTYFFDL